MSETEANTPAQIDIEQIDGLIAAAGPEGAREIFKAFWSSTESLVSQITAYLESGDGPEAAKVGHAIKGSAANVGAKKLTALAAELEIACKNESTEAAHKMLPELTNCYAEFKNSIEEYIANA